MAEVTDVEVKPQEVTTKRKSEDLLDFDSVQKPKVEDACQNLPSSRCDASQEQIKRSKGESLEQTQCLSENDIDQQKEDSPPALLKDVDTGDTSDLKKGDPEGGDSEVEKLDCEEADDEDDGDYDEEEDQEIEDGDEPRKAQDYRSDFSKYGMLSSSKGKGKLNEVNETGDSEVSDYTDEEDDVSDDDDPLEEVDLVNILPSRTRRGKQRGLNLH